MYLYHYCAQVALPTGGWKLMDGITEASREMREYSDYQRVRQAIKEVHNIDSEFVVTSLTLVGRR